MDREVLQWHQLHKDWRSLLFILSMIEKLQHLESLKFWGLHNFRGPQWCKISCISSLKHPSQVLSSARIFALLAASSPNTAIILYRDDIGTSCI